MHLPTHTRTSPLRRRPGPAYLVETGAARLEDLFEHPAPLELEIGSGKGKFLLYRAQAHPDINFVGFDYVWKYLKKGHEKQKKRDVGNLRFFKAEANDVINSYVATESLTVCHIYFPDPWHKKRHHKRRLLTADFFTRLHDRVKSGGLVELASDNADYVAMFRESIMETKSLWSDIREAKNERLFDPEYKTNFELKYEQEGRDLFYIELRK